MFFLTVFIELKTSFTMLLNNKIKQFYLKRKKDNNNNENMCIYYNNDDNNKDAC